MHKYGKSVRDILEIKSSYIEENDVLLAQNDAAAKAYLAGSERTACMVCGERIGSRSDFKSHGIGYCFCKKCGHLNGMHVDTEDFSEELYIQQDYGADLRSDQISYWERVKRIYQPKVQFLQKSLGGGYLQKSSLLDIGAGSGHFVAAALQEQIDAEGVEISRQQAEYANRHIGRQVIRVIRANELNDSVRNTRANIVTAIGVLEHVRDLDGVLQAAADNPHIRYLFCSLPMFSVSVMLEIMNQQCFNRHLGGGHTHLFTNRSVAYMCRIYGWEMEHTWRFGADMMDLYRMMCVSVQPYEMLTEQIHSVDPEIFDELQMILDKAELSSEKHFIFKKLK